MNDEPNGGAGAIEGRADNALHRTEQRSEAIKHVEGQAQEYTSFAAEMRERTSSMTERAGAAAASAKGERRRHSAGCR